LLNLSLLGNRWLLLLSGVGQRPGGSQADSQIAALGGLAHFSGCVDRGLVVALFEVQVPAACFEEGA
jgi:hypothetical protein